MASESKKQQSLLDSGFLNNIGTKDTPLVLNEVEKIIAKWMGLLVEALQKNINEPGTDGREITASGELSQSIRFEYTKNGMNYTGLVYMVDYADFRDKGVQGIGPNNKNTTSPYRFKTAFPSKDMQKALLLWVRQKSVLSEITAPKGLKGKNTRGFLRNKNRATSLAMALGIAIKRRGIKASNFKQVSIDQILEGMTQEIASATARDIKVNIETANLK